MSDPPAITISRTTDRKSPDGMIGEENDIRQIADYLAGELSHEEREVVAQRIKTDPGFQKLFVETKLLVTGIKAQGRQNLKQQFIDLERSLPLIEVKKSRSLWPWISAVAATLLIVALVFRTSQKPDSAELFEEYYSPYPNIVMPVVRGENQDSSARAYAFAAYEQHNYPNAVSAFETLEDQSDEVLFYLASSYLANGQTDQAIVIWLKLSESTSSRYKNQSLWYLALANIKLGQTREAEAALKKLLEHDSSYGPRAKELLDRLDQ
jgi:tetratricopeptide (TPR) repeat protein